MATPEVIRSEAVGQKENPADSHIRVTEPFALIIFGATGALTHSKLLPALFNLWFGDFFGAPFVIVGVGRRDKNDAQFRDDLRDSAEAHGRMHPGDVKVSLVAMAAALIPAAGFVFGIALRDHSFVRWRIVSLLLCGALMIPLAFLAAYED